MLFRKFLSFLSLMLVALGTLHAAPISTDVSEGNALKWMKSKNHQAYTIKKEISVKSNTSNRVKKRSAPKYKILELEPKGWVIVSLDDVINPIIGYGDSKIDADNIPPALIEYLEDIESKIEYLNRHPKSGNRKSRKEMLYAASDNAYIVQPLLWLGGTSEDDGLHWGQGKPRPCPSGYTCTENVFYNAQTPEWEPGNHTYTGCVATVMGQIMRYWKYPSVGRSQHCYTPQTHPEYGEQCVDFGSTTYDWDSMPLTLTSANYNVAQILYNAGVAVDMDYTNSGSGAYFDKQMQTYFAYKMVIEFDRDIDINTSVKGFLNINIPIIASGRNNSSGHLYIIDGYDGDGYYHFNWGWNGLFNGKYTLDNGTLGYVSNRFTAVAPTDPSPLVAIADSHFSDCIVEDLSLEDSSEIKELSLRYASSLNCTDKNITNMDGIEYFVNISSLYLSNNNLTSLDLSSSNKLVSLSLSSNNLSSLILAVGNRYSNINLNYNPINILEIDNLKNIEQLQAYGTSALYCWQKNALASENNITNIDMSCGASSGDALDTDGDGIANVDDLDDDNDGINDLLDDDIDGDGVVNADDTFPTNASIIGVLHTTSTVSHAAYKYYEIQGYSGEIIGALLSGLSADIDLYVKIGTKPTQSSYDCQSNNGGVNQEECTVTLTADETVYIGVYGYTAGKYTLDLSVSGDLKDTDGDGLVNHLDLDDDNDAISDIAEIANGLNPLDVSDAEADLDHDGFSNVVEISIGTDIRDANSKPTCVPVIMGDIITFVLVKG